MATQAEQQQQGEQMVLLNPASVPEAPSFPNRLFFAGGGLGGGLGLGLVLAFWLEFRDKSIRTQADAEAALELPMLVAVPWLAQPATSNGNGKRRFWNRNKHPDEKEAVKS
jgi:capsular polysaccharide biosynthesis protein